MLNQTFIQKIFSSLVFLTFFLSTIPPAADAVEQKAGTLDPLLARVYQQEDISQWWISEKLDGVRAIWNGKTLNFRSGKLIHVPEWFSKNFPKQSMDGELWLGRNTFDLLSGIVRKKNPVESEWRQVRYMLFELPESPGTFTTRVHKMVELTQSAKIPWLQAIPQIRLNSEDALLKMLDEIVQKGGEGLMLHRADSLYHSGRSDDLLKLKPWQDAEATVIEILPGKGKFSGMMGSLLVADENGRKFRIGTGFSNQERKNPPAVGTVITYKYTGRSKNGLPRFASFLRVHQQF
ncbi:MAG: DNA ligase [SAR324 cluster bacterium]|nr:DNA ligase [SAR324 cluster bacterium]MBL7035538.1 DNA ligase [SAR324 cluster bacterium]